MKVPSLKIATLIATIILFKSCINIKKEFEIELPGVPNEFAITSYLNVGYDSIANMQIEQLHEIGTLPPSVLADIKIFKGDQLVYEQSNCNSDNALNEFDLNNLEVDRNYTIEISDPKGVLKNCSATSYLFKKPEAGNIKYSFNKNVSDFADYSDKVTIGIKDEPGIKNIYYVEVNVIRFEYDYEFDEEGNLIDSTIHYYSSGTYPEEDNYTNYYIDDSKTTSDGYIYVNRLPTTWSNNAPDSMIIEYLICAVSEEEAKYTESVSASDSQDNPFAEPISTFTNFTNGNGIFSLRNVAHGKVKVKVTK